MYMYICMYRYSVPWVRSQTTEAYRILNSDSGLRFFWWFSIVDRMFLQRNHRHISISLRSWRYEKYLRIFSDVLTQCVFILLKFQFSKNITRIKLWHLWITEFVFSQTWRLFMLMLKNCIQGYLQTISSYGFILKFSLFDYWSLCNINKEQSLQIF